MKTRTSVADIAGAEKKLRQAEFFLLCLQDASKEIASRRSRGGPDYPEHLEFFFSACLSAAQSVYYVLDETGGQKFKRLQRHWRSELKHPERSRFGRMIGLRGKDVHFAKTGAKTLPKYVENNQWQDHFPYHHSIHYNAALFGPAPEVEMENPDGTKVKGSFLRGADGLYLDRGGKPVEATTECREFIEQLRSLLEATKAAFQ